MKSAVFMAHHLGKARGALILPLLIGIVPQPGCSNQTLDNIQDRAEEFAARISQEGGTINGPEGTIFEGLRIEIPPGSLSSPTGLKIVVADEEAEPLPENAVRCGTMFELQSDDPDVTVSKAFKVTLPFDPDIVAGEERTAKEVKVWVAEEDGWGQELQIESTADSVAIALDGFSIIAPGVDRMREETTGGY